MTNAGDRIELPGLGDDVIRVTDTQGNPWTRQDDGVWACDNARPLTAADVITITRRD